MKINFRKMAVMVPVLLLVLSGCSKGSSASKNGFTLQSAAFGNKEPIPEKYWNGYSEERKNISIPFNWINPPEGTQSFVLLLTHPHNGGRRIFWAVFNIPASCNAIPEDASSANLPDGSIEMDNYFRASGYYGPEPLRGGGVYEWTATLFALNTAIPGPDKRLDYVEVEQLLEGKILGQAEIIGTASAER